MFNGLVTIHDHAFRMERQTQPVNVFGAAPVEEIGQGSHTAGFRPVMRRIAVCLLLAASVAAATHGLLTTLSSEIEIRASVAIDRKGSAETIIDAAFLDAQSKLISSRDNLRRAATELGVVDARAFSSPSLQARILTALGMGGASKQVSPEERLTDALSARFYATPSGRGRAIDVRFTAENTDLGVRFVNRVVADYLSLQGTDGGVGARLVSDAALVDVPKLLSPSMGGFFAGTLTLLLGGIATVIGYWRRRDQIDLPEEAPLVVGQIESLELDEIDHKVVTHHETTRLSSIPLPTPPSIPGVDLAGRRRVAVACFGEGDENRRLVDELAREGGFNGARIVVIDASRRVEDRPGLAELLAGQAEFADVIQRNASSRAHEISAGRRPLVALADDVEAASMLLETLEQTYDLVLIDLGRLRADPAFTLFAKLAGQLMLTGEADAGAVDTLLAALGRRGVTGIVRVAAPSSEIAA